MAKTDEDLREWKPLPYGVPDLSGDFSGNIFSLMLKFPLRLQCQHQHPEDWKYNLYAGTICQKRN